jgi:hypothetical protein
MIRGRLGIRASVAAQLSLEKGERPKVEPDNESLSCLTDGWLARRQCPTRITVDTLLLQESSPSRLKRAKNEMEPGPGIICGSRRCHQDPNR